MGYKNYAKLLLEGLGIKAYQVKQKSHVVDILKSYI